MNDFTHTGRIIFEGGRQEDVSLKVSGKHWIDENRNRWQVKTGEKTNNQGRKYPHLMMHSIRKRPAPKKVIQRLTHQGRMRGRAGKGHLIKLRETPNYWVDKNGVRYKKKEHGWRMDGEYKQLLLNTIVPLEKVHGVPVAPKRTSSTHEVIES